MHLLFLNTKWTNLKLAVIFLLFLSVLNADKIKTKTLACPTIDQLKKAPVHKEAGSLELDMYVIANGCAILSPKSRVEAVGYDPRNSKDIYQKVVNKENGSIYFILRSQILVEQGGKKASMRF